jgi:hypothetical protein
MENKKPQVFPTREELEIANAVGTQLATNEEQVVIDDPIGNSSQVSNGESAASAEMIRRTQEQIELRAHADRQTKINKDAGIHARAELMKEMGVTNPNQPAPTTAPTTAPTNQPQIAPVDIQEAQAGAMSYEDIVKFQEYIKNVDSKRVADVTPPVVPPVVPPTPPFPPSPPINSNQPDDVYIQQLSEPNLNAAFDVIPLPSEGKLYPSKRKTIKVAYMTTADENILTSPNLLNSGRFLEVLMNRKILDTDIRYRDLVEGDRDAIMLWLRATGYGNMYPITVNDADGKPFETEVDLNEMKTKNLNVQPNKNGYFDFVLPTTQVPIEFKLLTVGDNEEITNKVDYEIETLKMPLDNTSLYQLGKHIVSINGDTNPEVITNFANNMRLLDKTKLTEYINSITCGIDMSITVGTPGGGSLDTFLPINLKFFWPNLVV